jgi:hypothetical protein
MMVTALSVAQIADGVRKMTSKMRHCFNCGEEIGFDAYYDPLDTCGKNACLREAQEQAQMERDERHEQLDHEMGYWR